METRATTHSGWRTYTLPYVTIFLAALLALAWQFVFPGYYNMYALDAAMLPKYVAEFNESFRQGILYPRWMAEDFWGYGSPMFVLYSPFLYIMSSAMNLSGLGLAHATAVIKLLSLFVGGVFLFHLLRKRHGDRAALIASLFYVLLPTRIYDIYYHNTPAGRFGEAFMPMTLFFVSEMGDGPMKRKDLAGFGLSYAGLILSHLASAYLFTPFIILYGLICRRKGALLVTALKIGSGIAAGILLSSFFFMPVLFERGLVHFEYNTNLYELFRFKYHVVINGYLDENNVYVPLKNSLAMEMGALLAVLYIIFRRGLFRFDRDSYFYAGSVLFSLFMMSFLSGFLWDGITALRTINLPSRFSAIYLIFISALFGIAMDRLLAWEERPRLISALSVGLIAVVFSYGLVMIKTSPRLTYDDYTTKLADRPDIQPEYLPKTVNLDTLSSLGVHDPRLSSMDRFSADIRRWGYVDRDFVVDSPRGARLRVKTFYFPGWRAWFDGKEVPLTAEDGTGAIMMAVPPGRHDVCLRFTNTPPRTWGVALSLLAFVILVFPRRVLLSRAPKSSCAGRPNG
jgi:hypothetical protein